MTEPRRPPGGGLAARLRAGITERATQMILADLVAAGYVRRGRTGHRTTYTVDLALPFRHPIEADHTVAELVSLFASPSAWQASRAG